MSVLLLDPFTLFGGAAPSGSFVLLSGDMQGGTDGLLLSGDMQSGTDKESITLGSSTALGSMTAASTPAGTETAHMLQGANSRGATITQMAAGIRGHRGKKCILKQTSDGTQSYNSMTLRTWGTEVLKDDAAFHSTGTNPSRLIAPWTGRYKVYGSWRFATADDWAMQIVLLGKNRAGSPSYYTDVPGFYYEAYRDTNSSYSWGGASFAYIDLTANDYLEMFTNLLFQAGSGSKTFEAAYTFFSLEYMGFG